VGVLIFVNNVFEQLVIRVGCALNFDQLIKFVVSTDHQHLRDLVSDLLAELVHKMVFDATGQQFTVHQHSLHFLFVCLFFKILSTQNWGFNLNVAE